MHARGIDTMDGGAMSDSNETSKDEMERSGRRHHIRSDRTAKYLLLQLEFQKI